jgi:hypothetical protein
MGRPDRSLPANRMGLARRKRRRGRTPGARSGRPSRAEHPVRAERAGSMDPCRTLRAEPTDRRTAPAHPRPTRRAEPAHPRPTRRAGQAASGYRTSLRRRTSPPVTTTPTMPTSSHHPADRSHPAHLAHLAAQTAPADPANPRRPDRTNSQRPADPAGTRHLEHWTGQADPANPQHAADLTAQADPADLRDRAGLTAQADLTDLGDLTAPADLADQTGRSHPADPVYRSRQAGLRRWRGARPRLDLPYPAGLPEPTDPAGAVPGHQKHRGRPGAAASRHPTNPPGSARPTGPARGRPVPEPAHPGSCRAGRSRRTCRRGRRRRTRPACRSARSGRNGLGRRDSGHRVARTGLPGHLPAARGPRQPLTCQDPPAAAARARKADTSVRQLRSLPAVPPTARRGPNARRRPARRHRAVAGPDRHWPRWSPNRPSGSRMCCPAGDLPASR